jgi:hypothetical protein
MIMGTLKGFPCPPALWLRPAKPAYAYAIMGTLEGLALHSAPTLPTPSPALCAASPNPPAMVRSRQSRLLPTRTGNATEKKSIE